MLIRDIYRIRASGSNNSVVSAAYWAVVDDHAVFVLGSIEVSTDETFIERSVGKQQHVFVVVKTLFEQAGDLVQVRLTEIDPATAFASGTLDQVPVVEGALVAIDNQTGQVRAMVGGFDFARSKFNRATQAWRQMGSTF